MTAVNMPVQCSALTSELSSQLAAVKNVVEHLSLSSAPLRVHMIMQIMLILIALC